MLPAPPQQPALIAMLDPGELTQGDPTGGLTAPTAAGGQGSSESRPESTAAFAPAEPPQPQSPTPTPQAPFEPPAPHHRQPEPAPLPAATERDRMELPPEQAPSRPEPAPAPSRPRPRPKPEEPAASPEAETPQRPKIKLDLREVKRPRPAAEGSGEASATPSPTKASKGSNKRAGATGEGAADTGRANKSQSANDIAKRLGSTLQRAGVQNAPATGGPSGGGGRGDEFSAYRTLIRDQLFQAWDRPVTLAGQKLTTIITIVLDRDGTILSVSLKQSSGNTFHDQTAVDAARLARKIKAPLPEGLNPRFDISFFLQD